MFCLIQLNVIKSSITILPFFQTTCRHYADYFCIFWFTTVYITWYMKEKWILPLTLCESTCNLADALMYKHFLLQAVFPKLLKLVQFPYVMHVNPLTYTIWTSMFYSCFAFCFQFQLYTLSQTTFYILHLTSYIHIIKKDHNAMDFQ